MLSAVEAIITLLSHFAGLAWVLFVCGFLKKQMHATQTHTQKNPAPTHTTENPSKASFALELFTYQFQTRSV